MTVEQLMQVLRQMPPTATVLLEDDGGLSPLGSVQLAAEAAGGLPAEVVLVPDLTPD